MNGPITIIFGLSIDINDKNKLLFKFLQNLVFKTKTDS